MPARVLPWPVERQAPSSIDPALILQLFRVLNPRAQRVVLKILEQLQPTTPREADSDSVIERPISAHAERRLGCE